MATSLSEAVKKEVKTKFDLAKFKDKKHPNGKKVGIPAALRKATKNILNNFDEYQLSKYRGEGKNVKMVDIVNLTHPKPLLNNNETFNKYIIY
jgi:hypothetical protein